MPRIAGFLCVGNIKSHKHSIGGRRSRRSEQVREALDSPKLLVATKAASPNALGSATPTTPDKTETPNLLTVEVCADRSWFYFDLMLKNYIEILHSYNFLNEINSQAK